MMLLWVAWIATWQAMCDPRLWAEAASSPSKKDERLTHKGNSTKPRGIGPDTQ